MVQRSYLRRLAVTQMRATILDKKPGGGTQKDNTEHIASSGAIDQFDRRLLSSMAGELVVYAIIVIAYFFVVLQFLGDLLTKLFKTDLSVYSVIAISLIVIQGVALEFLTGLLLRGFGALKSVPK